MKCFNITDVETEELKKRGLVRTTLAVHGILIAPGESAEVPDDELSKRDAKGYVEVKALAVDELPASYVVAKSRTGRPAPLPPPPPVKKKNDEPAKG